MFEQFAKPGGLMRTNIPSSVCPITCSKTRRRSSSTWRQVRYNTPITSLRSLLGEGFDAIFVGVGAPRGKELTSRSPRRSRFAHLHRYRLARVGGFGHVTSIGSRS